MSPAGRGAGWVWLQFALMAVLFGAGFLPPDWPPGAKRALALIGLALFLAGCAIVVWSARLLGRGFTPYPRPSARGELVERGPYRVVRHPIYAGALVLFVGYSLCTGVLALVVTAGLGVVWALKAGVEERLLRQRYAAYAGYARRVRFRLVPFLY
jgi:protein-S-isoprenylcysteine O-methyltransferase Ste14